VTVGTVTVGRSTFIAVIGGLSLLAGGCASTDLGTPCHLLRADNTEMSPSPGHDIVQSGSGECEQFACVSFNGGTAQCSALCDRMGDPCAGGMTCRQMVLDPDLLAAARARTEGHDDNHNGIDDFQEFLAGLTTSLYCGPKPS
jgi:hypothetical protein